MNDYTEQVQRIKDKLIKAKEADPECRVFGANYHQYQLKRTVSLKTVAAFEEKYGVVLPQAYKAFVTKVGSGGQSIFGAGAGPFYGIYRFGQMTDELVGSEAEKYLKNECLLHPKMTDEYWRSLMKNIDENQYEWDSEPYAAEVRKIFAGILPLGSQGCSYLHGLVLNGPYTGRVVNLDIERHKPQFSFEANFLDWYERWLDEIIDDDIQKSSSTWFGYCKGGTEDDLLAEYVSFTDPETKRDCLLGLLEKKWLKIESLLTIERFTETDTGNFDLLVRLICHSDYQRAKPYLLQLYERNLNSFFYTIFWYARDHFNDWLSLIEESGPRITDEETFLNCSYIITRTRWDYGKFVEPFTKSPNEEMRIYAFNALAALDNKKAYLPLFISGLNDTSDELVVCLLRSLSGCIDDALLPHYRRLAEKIRPEQEELRFCLNDRLSEYGLTIETILETK